jgi:hypothetical protein
VGYKVVTAWLAKTDIQIEAKAIVVCGVRLDAKVCMPQGQQFGTAGGKGFVEGPSCHAFIYTYQLHSVNSFLKLFFGH